VLLDYGGWERLHDTQGDPYVALYFQYFKAFTYSAVATANCDVAPEGLMQRYAALPGAPQLLASSAALPPAAALKVYTREMHGEHWGFASIPYIMTRQGGEAEASAELSRRIEAAYTLLDEAGCARKLLIASNIAQRGIYSSLAKDKRFLAVIGGPPSKAPLDGYGKLGDGPLMLRR
jgi:hypothetical protein